MNNWHIPEQRPRIVAKAVWTVSIVMTVFAIIAMGMGTVGAREAQATACDSARYKHNGSVMMVHACQNGQFTIEYDQPRSSLSKHGVRPGTVLFQGNFWESGGVNLRRVRGTAYVFKQGCQPAPYQVEGYWLENGTLEMVGSAPVRKTGCTVGAYRKDDLLFLGM